MQQDMGGGDYYEDAAPTEAKPESKPEVDTGGKTALIPKDMCPGMKPGDEITLKIERDHGDQYEVSYNKAGAEPDEDDTGAAPAAPDKGGDDMYG